MTLSSWLSPVTAGAGPSVPPQWCDLLDIFRSIGLVMSVFQFLFVSLDLVSSIFYTYSLPDLSCILSLLFFIY